MESNDPIKELIQVWHDSVVEFGRELKDFINGLPVERANFWGIDLWLFLQEQRDRGMKVDGESYQRLRTALEGYRDRLIAEGVELQQTYTPSAEQTARERAAMRARNERHAPPRSSFFKGMPSANQPEQPTRPLLENEIRYWIELLRPLIRAITQNYPPERWVERVKDALARVKPPQEIADRILAWITSESERRLFFKRIVDDALHQSAGQAASESEADVSPAEELANLLAEIVLGVKELSADGKPERLFKAMRRLTERFPAFIPDSLRTKEFNELLIELQQFMREFLDFLEALPPEAYALIPDLLQAMLDIVGLIPGLGEITDAISAAFSYLRGEYLDLILSVASMIPVLGTIPGVAKILRRLNTILNKVLRMGKGTVREVLEALLKLLIEEAGEITVSIEWFKKFLQRMREKIRELLDKLKRPGKPDGKRPGPGGPQKPPPDPKNPRPGNVKGPGKWAKVNEAMSPRARAYQAQITGRPGEAYIVKGVKFDGFVDEVLVEAKGPGYASFVKDGKFTRWFNGKDGMVKQAKDQAGAANGDPVTWHVAEKEVVKAIKDLFHRKGVGGIEVVHTPAAF